MTKKYRAILYGKCDYCADKNVLVQPDEEDDLLDVHYDHEWVCLKCLNLFKVATEDVREQTAYEGG